MSRTFPTLYQLKGDSTKIIQWSIRIESYRSTVSIIVEHGEVGGKITRHTKEVLEGRGGRTKLQQAELIVLRKWQDRKDKDRFVEDPTTLRSMDVLDSNKTRRLDMSGATSPTTTASASINPVGAAAAAAAALPSVSGTVDMIDKSGVRPMLAGAYDKKKRMVYPVYVQRKYDGVRCLAYRDSRTGSIELMSRQGIKFQLMTHLEDELMGIFERYPDVILDGELYSNELEFSDISGAVRLRRERGTESEASRLRKIEYHVYDVIILNEIRKPYRERLEWLLFHFTEMPHVKLVESLIANNAVDIKTYHDSFVQNGYEGLIIRLPDGPYEIQKRSRYLLKYKEFQDEEFRIIGFKEGAGDDVGTVIWEVITKGGVHVWVKPMGSREYRRTLFQNAADYVGKDLTVVFFGYTADGSLRHPVGKDIRISGT